MFSFIKIKSKRKKVDGGQVQKAGNYNLCNNLTFFEHKICVIEKIHNFKILAFMRKKRYFQIKHNVLFFSKKIHRAAQICFLLKVHKNFALKKSFQRPG